jgi:hypothetical protein
MKNSLISDQSENFNEIIVQFLKFSAPPFWLDNLITVSTVKYLSAFQFSILLLLQSPFHVDLEETVLEKLQKSVTVERFNHMTTEDISKQCEGLVKGTYS